MKAVPERRKMLGSAKGCVEVFRTTRGSTRIRHEVTRRRPPEVNVSVLRMSRMLMLLTQRKIDVQLGYLRVNPASIRNELIRPTASAALSLHFLVVA
ncbi:MAG: hypothetical protein ABGW50_02050 [Thermococcus sp.]